LANASPPLFFRDSAYQFEMIFFVAGTLILLLFLCWTTFRSAIYLREFQLNFNLLLLPAENAVRILLIAVCIWLAVSSAQPFARFGWDVLEPVRDVVIGFAVGVLVALALPTVTRIAIARFGTQVYSPIVVQSILPRNSREGLLVPLALIPAVLLEELLFRGLLVGGFAIFAPPLVLAVVWSILFGEIGRASCRARV
jgi:membrane protease YdiL (CAAX protease family)